MTFRVLVMGGEGVGPEVTDEAVRILRRVQRERELDIHLEAFEVGVGAHEKTGKYLPDDAERACREIDAPGAGAILFGSTSDEPIGILRHDFDLFANLRPIRGSAAIDDISPLRRGSRGVDMLIVRELVSGIYYGKRTSGTDAKGRWAAQEKYYHETEVRRIVSMAFALARSRRRKLTFVHKRVVIPEVFDLWFACVDELKREYADIEVSDYLVDNMAMQLLLQPESFDVVVTSNLFGDILSDIGAGILGSIGLVPSASLNERGMGLYEPIGGTAPTLARNTANPTGSILSAASMFRHSLRDVAVAEMIEASVEATLSRARTKDVHREGYQLVSTSEFGALVEENLQKRLRDVS